MPSPEHAASCCRPIRIRGHHILGGCLPRGAVVLDVGAHRGEFSRHVKSGFGCRCYGLEPNPALFNALADSDFECKASWALSGQDGTACFQLSDNPEAGHLSSDAQAAESKVLKVEAVSLETAMRRFGLDRVDLLKLDIDGAEFQVLTESPAHVLQRIGQITVEFHDFLPQWKGTGHVAGVRRRLESLGFIYCKFSFRTHGDVLFINSARHKLSFFRKFYLRHLARIIEKATGGRAAYSGTNSDA